MSYFNLTWGCSLKLGELMRMLPVLVPGVMQKVGRSFNLKSIKQWEILFTPVGVEMWRNVQAAWAEINRGISARESFCCPALA